MNNYKGKVVTTLYRRLASEEAIDSFEQELLELLDVGYEIKGFGMSECFIYALLYKTLESQTIKKAEP